LAQKSGSSQVLLWCNIAAIVSILFLIMACSAIIQEGMKIQGAQSIADFARDQRQSLNMDIVIIHMIMIGTLFLNWFMGLPTTDSDQAATT
jgi:hypothetical protein